MSNYCYEHDRQMSENSRKAKKYDAIIDENTTLRTLVIQLCVVLKDATGYMMDVAMDEDKGHKYRKYVKEARRQLREMESKDTPDGNPDT